MTDWLRQRGGGAVVAVAALAVLGVGGGIVLGATTAHSAKYGVAALLAVVLLTAVLPRPVNMATIALAAVYAVQRVGSSSFAPGSQGGISYSDALLTIAAFMAVPALIGTEELQRLRLCLLGLAGYLACLLASVLLNPSQRAYLEWTHRLVLVGGGLLVGAWIARERIVRTALRCLTAISCVMAALAVEYSATHGFAAASPLQLNKNFIGAILSMVVVVVAAAWEEIGLSPRVRAFVLILLAGGLLTSQSRGGMIAAVLGLLIAYMVAPQAHSRRARAFAVLIAVILGVFAFISVRDQLSQDQADLNNGSLGVRYNVEKVTRQVWRTSPAYGVGLKYFNTGKFGPYAQPANNVVDNELAESGVIGLIGFAVLQSSVAVAGFRRRRDGVLVTAGLGVVLGELLHGMVDIYWSAGVAGLPFILLGLGLAQRHPSGRDIEPANQVGGGKTMLSASSNTFRRS